MAITQGTWGPLLGPASYLDFGVTEGVFGDNAGVLSNPNQRQAVNPSYYTQPNLIPNSLRPTNTSSPAPTTTPQGGTSTGTPVNQPSAPGAPGAPSVEDQARNDYFAYLDSQMSSLPGVQSSLEGQIGNAYQGQRSSINTALQTTQNNLDQSRNEITENKVSSLRDLDQSMMNQLRAGNVYLGSRGAGDSSASDQYAYALSKMGTQSRSDVQRQANQLYSQVNTQWNNAQSVAQDQLNQLDTWKNSQLADIGQYVQSLRGNIDAARATYIQDRLSQIDNQVNTYKNAIATWISSNADSVGQVINQLQQYGISPNTSITSSGIPSTNWTGGGQTGGNAIFGYGGQRKDERTGY